MTLKSVVPIVQIQEEQVGIVWEGTDHNSHFFPLTYSPNHPDWKDNPTSFRVVCLDRLNDWPMDPSIRSKIARFHFQGDRNRWAAYLISGTVTQKDRYGIGPCYLVLPVPLFTLADQIVYPLPYLDLDVLHQEKTRVSAI